MSRVPESSRRSEPAEPLVTVIVAAYNAEASIDRCIGSVLAQTLEPECVELIVVDDGSTDRTGAALDGLTTSQTGRVRVYHQNNSGGPSAPRNLGLDHARGRYVFFLDADDYLGSEALARLVESAETNGSDVVLGRMKGVGGRGVPRSMFRENQAAADLFESRVYWSLSAQKLFRRDLIERLGLRFPTDLHLGEDQPFTATAYLNARRISVVADYDCYHLALEEGGSHLSRDGSVEACLDFLERVTALVAASIEPGPKRDALMHRHFGVDVYWILRRWAREPDPAVRARHAPRFRAILERYYNGSIASRLPPMHRVQLQLLERGLLNELVEVIRFDAERRPHAVIAEDGRAYAAYPYFRDPAAAVPDACFEMTSQVRLKHRLRAVEFAPGGRLRIRGHAYLERVDHRDAQITLILRRRGGTQEHAVAVDRAQSPEVTAEFGEGYHNYDRVGFDALIDLPGMAGGALLAPGFWDPFVTVSVNGVTRTGRLGHRASPDVAGSLPIFHVADPAGTNAACATVVVAYLTPSHGNLSLDVGPSKHNVGDRMLASHVAWAARRRGTLRIEGRVHIGALPADALSVVLLGPAGAIRRVSLEHEDGAFSGAVPLTQLARGRWRAELETTFGGRTWRVEIPRPATLGPTRWMRLGAPGYAKLVDGPSLTVEVSRVNILRALSRRLRRARERGSAGR